MKRFIDRLLKRDDRGMSIVTVIVAIGFVAILVSIILMTSVINFKMKSVNVYAKDSFYSAEQVLDEINVGLQQMVSDGLGYAYTSVMTNYNIEDMSASDKNNLVRAAYYEYLWSKLGEVDADGKPVTYVDPGNGKKYYKYVAQPLDGSAKGLYGLLKLSTQWHPDTDIDKTYGAFLRSTEDDGTNYMGVIRTYDTTGLVLKDLTVYYKDANGFISAVKTDIRLEYPEFSFSSNDIPDISGYSFITDTAYVQLNPGVTKDGAVETKIKGNTYAYAMDISGAKVMNEAITDDTDTHIVATDLNLVNGGFDTNGSSLIWAGDIDSKSSNLTLAGQTYVYDDLNITGRDSNVTLKGYYTGFGNSMTDSQKSSAILVNGVNTAIDISNIKKLSLAGRAYIGTSDKNGVVGRVKRDSDDVDENAQDVFTGESIAVKSDQLMYLVPGDCIGVALDENGNPTTSMYGKNPLTLEEYNSIMSNVNSHADNGYVEVAANKPIRRLMGNTDTYTDEELAGLYLGHFVKTDETGKVPEVEKVFLKTADGSSRLVYYYMTFKDDQAANDYFYDYYNLNKESVDKYLKSYLSAIKMPDYGNVTTKVDLAGYALNGDKTNGYEISDNLRAPEAGGSIADSYEETKENLRQIYEAYCSKLKSDYDSIADTASMDILRTEFPEYDRENKRMKVAENAEGVSESDKLNYYTVFKNFVNEEVLKDIVGGHTGTLELDGEYGKVLLIYDTNVNNTYNVSSSYTLVIANCGVNLTSSAYTGCIIAKGIIQTPTGNMSFTADREKVGGCLLYETDDKVYKVNDVFGTTSDYTYTTNTTGTGETVTSASLVTYENWTKNVNIK